MLTTVTLATLCFRLATARGPLTDFSVSRRPVRTLSGGRVGRSRAELRAHARANGANGVGQIPGGVPTKAPPGSADASRWPRVTLFDDESTLRVADLNARIARVVVRSLPGEHWVRGEV